MTKIIKVIGNYLLLGIILFITYELYYEIIVSGINSFYYPEIGIIGAIGLPVLCIVYVIKFILPRSNN